MWVCMGPRAAGIWLKIRLTWPWPSSNLLWPGSMTLLNIFLQQQQKSFIRVMQNGPTGMASLHEQAHRRGLASVAENDNGRRGPFELDQYAPL